MQQDSRYINEDYSLNLDPPSPTQQSYDFDYNPDYNNSPFSDHSELSLNGDDVVYNPAEYDHPVAANSLLMFNDSDYMTYSMQQPYPDYSSPSDNGEDGQRSRASSVSSQHLHPSPRLDVAHSFENMSFQSPNWGTEPLPEQRRMSIAKPQSPPRLLMPDSESSFEQAAPPTINAPDDDGDAGGGPKLRIVPATPVSGGGIGGGNETMPFTRGASHLGAPSNLGVIDEPGYYSTNNASSSNTPPSSGSQAPAPYNTGSTTSPPSSSSLPSQPQQQHLAPQHSGSASAGASQANFLFPNPSTSAFRSRSKSDPPLPAWSDTTEIQVDESALLTMDDMDSTSGGTGVNMHDVSPPPTQTRPHPPSGYLLSPDLNGLRRSKSDAPRGHTRQSRSEDFRGLLAVPGQQANGLGLTTSGPSMLGFPPSSHEDFINMQRQYLSPMEPPPAIRGHGHSQSFSGNPTNSLGLGGMPMPVGAGRSTSTQGHVRRASSGTRSERGAESWGSSGSPDPYGHSYDHSRHRSSSPYGSNRASPYISPNVSPRVRPEDLPREDPLETYSMPYNNGGQGSGFGSQHASRNASPVPGQGPTVVAVGGSAVSLKVSKQNVTTGRTAKASHNRRKQEATFVCPVPGCGSTFTRSFNLKGHIRSHNEEKPFLCHWPGCGKGFARQHDCKRHEQLHTNYRPFTCDGCQKPFARMDALNRHLRSEGGAECQRILEMSGNLPSDLQANSDKAAAQAAAGSRRGSYSAPAKALPVPLTPQHHPMELGMGGRQPIHVQTNMKMDMDWSQGLKVEDSWGGGMSVTL